MAVTNQQIIDYLNANPNITGPELQAVMDQFKVSPAQIATALAEDASKYGTQTQTLVNPESGQMNVDLRNLGAGFNAYQDESGQISSFSRVDPSRPGMIQLFGPNGEYRGEEKIQSLGSQIWSDIGPVAKAFAATTLAQGLMGSDLFGGTSAADAAAAAADADIAGGLIPEFGTNAAYGGFMAGAMTPEALAALEAIVAANPEIIGSGALLTDAAAGLTPAITPAGGPTNVVTTPTTPVTPTTPTTPVTPVTSTTPAVTPVTPVPPTVPSVLPTDITKYLTPSVVASLTGLFGGSVLNRAMSGGGGSTPATPVSIPTQGMPLNSQDYFNAIQQNYNQLMPAVPRDVATPLAAWYNSKYGA